MSTIASQPSEQYEVPATSILGGTEGKHYRGWGAKRGHGNHTHSHIYSDMPKPCLGQVDESDRATVMAGGRPSQQQLSTS